MWAGGGAIAGIGCGRAGGGGCGAVAAAAAAVGGFGGVLCGGMIGDRVTTRLVRSGSCRMMMMMLCGGDLDRLGCAID